MVIYIMKYLYVSRKDLDGFCSVEDHMIGDFIYNGERFYCTKLTDINKTRNQTRFDFILKSYNFNIILAHVEHDDINLFMKWRNRYFPNIETHVNVYKTEDKDESLYLLNTDNDLNVIGYFFKKFVPVLSLITSMADIPAV